MKDILLIGNAHSRNLNIYYDNTVIILLSKSTKAYHQHIHASIIQNVKNYKMVLISQIMYRI